MIHPGTMQPTHAKLILTTFIVLAAEVVVANMFFKQQKPSATYVGL